MKMGLVYQPVQKGYFVGSPGHTTSSWLVAVPFFLLTMLARAGLLSSHTTSRLNPVLVAVSFLGEVAGLTPGSVVVTR